MITVTINIDSTNITEITGALYTFLEEARFDITRLQIRRTQQ